MDSADADSVLLPGASYCCHSPQIIVTSLPSSAGTRGTDTLALAMDAFSSKLRHFDTHSPR